MRVSEVRVSEGAAVGKGRTTWAEDGPIFSLLMTHTVSFANTTAYRTAVERGQVSADLDGGGVRLSFRQGGSAAAFLGGTGLQSFKRGSRVSLASSTSERSSATPRRRHSAMASAHPPTVDETSIVTVELPRLKQVKLDDLMRSSRKKISEDI